MLVTMDVVQPIHQGNDANNSCPGSTASRGSSRSRSQEGPTEALGAEHAKCLAGKFQCFSLPSKPSGARKNSPRQQTSVGCKLGFRKTPQEKANTSICFFLLKNVSTDKYLENANEMRKRRITHKPTPQREPQ